MRSLVPVIPLLLTWQVAYAQTATVGLADITSEPKQFVGRSIRVTGFKCANEPNGLFACGAKRDATLVRVESLALDFKTSTATRRKLIARCRMPLLATPDTCVFTVEFKPLSATSSRAGARTPTTTLYFKTRRMDLF